MTAKWQYKEAYEAALVTARELRAENAKLRTQLTDSTESMGRVEERCAKLREIVAAVHESLCLDKIGLFREAIIESLEHDMRELGIEVKS